MVVAELYVWTTAILALLNLGLMIYAWLNPQIPGAFTCGLIGLAVAEICLMFQLLTTAPTPELGFTYARLRFLGLAVANPLMLIFVLQYTRLTQWLKPPIIAALFIVPVITQLVLWFTPSAETFFGGWSLTSIGGFQFEARNLTGWYGVHGVYNGALMLVTFSVMGWYTRRVDSARRGELYWMLLLALVAAYGASTPLTLGPPPGLKLTPLALGIASLGMGWFLLGGSRIRVMPVAYDVVFSGINDAVLVLDPQDRVIKANPAAELLLGRPLASMLFQPVDAAMTGATGWLVHEGELAPFEITLQNGASPVPCEVRRLPLMRGSQQIGGLVVLRDVTAQHKALELAIERERSQVVANFITDASHEFRTPLSVIKSSAYLLSRGITGDHSMRHITKINDHVDRINALVNDLQIMASLDTDDRIAREPVDLRELVINATEGFARPLADARQQTLMVNIDPALPIPHGDSAELTLALQKVLDNAIRYTSERGMITVSAQRIGSGTMITIRDSGVGMDVETAQAALQRFYRLDSARSTSGFGLGLPIAQKIMDRHGGTLTLTSAPNAGTTVRLSLP